MGFKDIVVHVSEARTSRARVEAAVSLAADHGAHVRAIHVFPTPAMVAPASISTPPGLTEALLKAHREQAEGAQAMFEDLATAAGVEHQWRGAHGDVRDQLLASARCSDILVLGQEDDESAPPLLRGLPDGLALEAGRPVLVIPYIGCSTPMGRRALVAWNGSREAVRAVNDALPMLRVSDSVVVLSFGNQREDPEGIGCNGADLARHLARHGVNAEPRELPVGDIEVGDMLLSRAADEGADLIVMGAYGRTRFREIVLGGVTRHLFRHMTVPVLMSH